MDFEAHAYVTSASVTCDLEHFEQQTQVFLKMEFSKSNEHMESKDDNTNTPVPNDTPKTCRSPPLFENDTTNDEFFGFDIPCGQENGADNEQNKAMDINDTEPMLTNPLNSRSEVGVEVVAISSKTSTPEMRAHQDLTAEIMKSPSGHSGISSNFEGEDLSSLASQLQTPEQFANNSPFDMDHYINQVYEMQSIDDLIDLHKSLANRVDLLFLEANEIT